MNWDQLDAKIDRIMLSAESPSCPEAAIACELRLLRRDVCGLTATLDELRAEIADGNMLQRALARQRYGMAFDD